MTKPTEDTTAILCRWLKQGRTDYIAYTMQISRKSPFPYSLCMSDPESKIMCYKKKNSSNSVVVARRYSFTPQMINDSFGQMLLKWYLLDQKKGLADIEEETK